jgi:hypothetical protein
LRLPWSKGEKETTAGEEEGKRKVRPYHFVGRVRLNGGRCEYADVVDQGKEWWSLWERRSRRVLRVMRSGSEK